MQHALLELPSKEAKESNVALQAAPTVTLSPFLSEFFGVSHKRQLDAPADTQVHLKKIFTQARK